MKLYDKDGNRYIPSFKTKYVSTIVPKLKKKFGLSNDLEVPVLKKIVVNIGKKNVGINQIVSVIKNITGQHPVVCTAKKSIADFKIRENDEIGAKSTCRGDSMYNVLKKVFCARINGYNKCPALKVSSIIKGKNYFCLTTAFSDTTLFNDVAGETSGAIIGCNISFVVARAKKLEHVVELFKCFGFNFKGHKYEIDREVMNNE